MLNYVNRKYRKHILTLEDPIEFVFTEEKCLINQREIGQDVKDFLDRDEACRPRGSGRDAGR
jgi:twitching motility protein PilT